MKTTPLLMTGGNVRLIQQDLKTNTRRVVPNCPSWDHCGKDIMDWGLSGIYQDEENTSHAHWWLDVQTDVDDNSHDEIKCPYGGPGDRLAIKETFWAWGEWFQRPDHSKNDARAMRWEWLDLTDAQHPVIYDCDISEEPKEKATTRDLIGYHKRPSIYLPKTAWRLFLEITRVDVERLQSIQQIDAEAEGCFGKFHGKTMTLSPIAQYRDLWESINGKQRPGKPDISWAANPMVYSIHFKRIS